jgi:hypothetical protein
MYGFLPSYVRITVRTGGLFKTPVPYVRKG